MALLTPSSPVTARVTAGPAVAASAVSTAPGGRAPRDGSVDAVRAILLGIVVALHAIMVGVSVAPDGTPLLRNAMEGWDGFGPITWVAQIMPLFFVLGGFASFTQWTRLQTRGTTAGSYVAGRMRRLLVPAVGAVTAAALFLAVLAVVGVPADVVATAGFRIGQPLWFLGVYVGCTALVPLMVRLHRSHPLRTYAVLAAGAIAVDIVRGATGIAPIGLLNMAFIWLLLQQIGFALAEGRFDRLRPRTLVPVAAAAVVGIAVLMLSGAAPADLISALNPPMTVLVLVGVVQTAVFLLLRPRLRVWAARPRPAAAIGWVNARAMTIYAWHMLVVVALAGALLLLPMALPAPLSSEWWLGRPLWILAVAAAVLALVAVVGRQEAQREQGIAPAPAWRGALAAILGMAGVVTVLAMGSLPSAWVVAAGLVALAVRIARPRSGAGIRAVLNVDALKL